MQYYNGQWTHHPQVRLGFGSLSATRDLIEQSLRTQLLTLKPNVTVRGGAIADSLMWDGEKTRVQGSANRMQHTSYCCSKASSAMLAQLMHYLGAIARLLPYGSLQHSLALAHPHSPPLSCSAGFQGGCVQGQP